MFSCDREYEYERVGQDACILTHKHMNTYEDYAIPEKVDDYTVQGIANSFLRDIENVSILTLPRFLRSINISGADYVLFAKESALSYISVANENKYFKAIDGVLFDYDCHKLLLYPPAKIGAEYRVPQMVTTISDQAFCYANSLCALVLDLKLKELTRYSICNCNSLYSLTITGPSTKIDFRLFKRVVTLKDIVFPNDSSFYEFRNDGLFEKPHDKENGYTLHALFTKPNARHYVVPYGTSLIGAYALEQISNIKKVYVPVGCAYYGEEEYTNLVPYEHDELKSDKEIQDKIEQIDESFNSQTDEQILRLIKTQNTRDSNLDYMLKTFLKNGKVRLPSSTDFKRFRDAVLAATRVRDDAKLLLITDLTIPTGIKGFDPDFLMALPNLSSIEGPSSGYYYVKDNAVYTAEKVVFYPPCCRNRTVTLKAGTRLSIQPFAFLHNQFLENIVIESEQVSICAKAFYQAKNLRYIICKGKITGLEACAFSYIKSQSIEMLPRDGFEGVHRDAINDTYCNKHLYFNSENKAKALKATVSTNDTVYFHVTNQLEIDTRIRTIFEQYKYPLKWFEKGVKNDTSLTANQKNLTRQQTMPQPAPVLQPKPAVLPRNSHIEIVVAVNRFACMAKHHVLEDRDVTIKMQDKNHIIREVKVTVGYCRHCKKYFVYSNRFSGVKTRLENQGWKIIGTRFFIKNGPSYGTTFEGAGNLLSESVLKACGYRVGVSSNLTSTQRMNILREVIKAGFLTRQEVMSYLNWFITFNGHRKNMSYAIRDWKHDLNSI